MKIIFNNVIYIPESFNTNISHRFFTTKKDLLNLQHEKKKFKDDFLLKKPV